MQMIIREDVFLGEPRTGGHLHSWAGALARQLARSRQGNRLKGEEII